MVNFVLIVVMLDQKIILIIQVHSKYDVSNNVLGKDYFRRSHV